MIDLFSTFEFFDEKLQDLELIITKNYLGQYVITIEFKKEGIRRYKISQILDKQISDAEVIRFEFNSMLEKALYAIGNLK